MIDVSGYVVTDAFFGAPYIDIDEERDLPLPHRHVHGGFEGTATTFRFHFPPKDGSYAGRMFNPLSGANGGADEGFGLPFGDSIGGISACFRLGGYMVESNQGHAGDELDPKAGEDPTIYGHRASAEAARFSKYVAQQVYGEAPHHSYVFGGSGGGRRSPLCLENAPDAWDGALPYMGGGDIAPHGNTQRLKGAQAVSFPTMFNVQRILGPKLAGVVDAMSAGGTGDPFAGLDTHQRDELAALYRLGYPRGDEHMIGEQLGQIWLWASMADTLHEQDPTYFTNFWSTPGYVGHDMPGLLQDDLIDMRGTVEQVFTARGLLESGLLTEPDAKDVAVFAGIMSQGGGRDDLPIAVQVKGIGRGYRMGASVRVTSGKGSGRSLYAMAGSNELILCDGRGTNSTLRFRDVLPGDEVAIDNRAFLAYCYWTRHHLLADPQFDFLRVDGRPIHPQHESPDMSSFMGVAYSGQYKGKLLWTHHTHDASLWPAQGVIYGDAVRAAQGDAGADERFRIYWTQNAEHLPPSHIPGSPTRASNTWLVDYMPLIEQGLADLVDWVERGIEPASTSFAYHDGLVELPETAAERRGIQPVVHATANGEVRAEVRAGEPVTLELRAETPPGGGTIISAEWDFDGSGSYPFTHEGIDGSAARVTLSTTHTYDRPGTYFATALVHSHRDGDVKATSRRLPNLAQARIVVT